jgi:hypothetical protein
MLDVISESVKDRLLRFSRALIRGASALDWLWAPFAQDYRTKGGTSGTLSKVRRATVPPPKKLAPLIRRGINQGEPALRAALDHAATATSSSSRRPPLRPLLQPPRRRLTELVITPWPPPSSLMVELSLPLSISVLAPRCKQCCSFTS